jgi:dienelactone hydrolase
MYPNSNPYPLYRALRIPAGRETLEAELACPPSALGLVLFAHGSGSSRFSPRNRHVARLLHVGRLATVLADLLTVEEESIDARTRELRFNIDMLAERLGALTDWLVSRDVGSELPIGYFGASTGAAAALMAAAERPDTVRAVVSRGGRPDLAAAALPRVKAPTLLIVGGADEAVMHLNRRALAQLTSERELTIVPRASHLFEEAGTLDEAGRLAREWFVCHLSPLMRPVARDSATAESSAPL